MSKFLKKRHFFYPGPEMGRKYYKDPYFQKTKHKFASISMYNVKNERWERHSDHLPLDLRNK